MVRGHPADNRRLQIVILDHGLYIQESAMFMKQYRSFWKAMFTSDKQALSEICSSWGIRDANLFASATLMKPYNPDKAIHIAQFHQTSKEVYEMQVLLKEKIRTLLENTEKVPRELIFVGRNMNLVRANNKELGSPVNRISIMADWAIRSMDSDWRIWNTGNIESRVVPNHKSESSSVWVNVLQNTKLYVLSQINYWHYKSVLWLFSIGFYMTKISQTLNFWVFGRRGTGFEDLLDAAMPENWFVDKTKLDA
jgi:aarF domain-containing kinase